MGESQYSFGPFRLDLAKRALTDAGRRVDLSGRALDLLAMLIRERHRAVSREELMAELWPDVVVEDGNLTVNISLLRKALHGGRAYIETLPRRGYRFCGELAGPRLVADATPASDTSELEAEPASGARATGALVGRARERDQLQRLRARAAQGRRQTLFVTGELGAGKTALTQAFIADATALGGAEVAVLRGHCIEHRGDSEPYLPVLEGLGRLCASPDAGARLLQLLDRVAPTWLLQLNRWIEPERRAELEQRVAGLSARRMAREFADLVESFSADRTLLVCLDDLHWADPSTLDLVAHLARQTEPARCMVLATYRPADAGAARALGRLAAGLRLQGLASEIELAGLTPADIGEYIGSRFDGARPGERLAAVIHERTRGNPLFMVQVVDALVEALPPDVESRRLALGGVAALGRLGAMLPATTAARIELEVDRLEIFERRILDAGSIVGGRFTAMVVASALCVDVVQVERVCQAWAREKRLLLSTGEATWPDGSRGTCYDLIHALYRDVLSRRLGAATRAQLHQRIAERLERGFDGQARRVASELGHHFANGTEPRRAVPYLIMAGQTALARGAYREAAALFRRALAIVQAQPPRHEGALQSAELQIWIGAAAVAMHGFSSPVAARAYRRARRVCDAMGGDARVSPIRTAALFGSWVAWLTRGRMRDALRAAWELHAAASRRELPAALADAHLMLGYTRYYVGDPADALSDLERALELFEAGAPSNVPRTTDPRVMAWSHAGRVLVSLGRREQALEHIERAIERARALTSFSLAPALHCASLVHLGCGEHAAAQAAAERLQRLSEREGFPQYEAMGVLCRGAARSALGDARAGLEDLMAGRARLRALGARVGGPLWLLQTALALQRLGRVEEASSALNAATAVIEETGERWCELDVERARRELARDADARLLRRA